MNPRKIKEGVRNILRLDEPPHELAKSFAVGVFVSFTPFIGLHTLLVLLMAWVFRLNKVVALMGTFVNNPWTIAVVYIGPTWLAVFWMRRIGIPVPKLNYEHLVDQFHHTLESYSVWAPAFWIKFLSEFKPFIHAFLIGTTLAGIVTGFIAYFAAYYAIKYYRAKIKRQAVQ